MASPILGSFDGISESPQELAARRQRPPAAAPPPVGRLYARGEHIVLRGVGPNKFWRIRLMIIGAALVPILLWVALQFN